jgi:hypothetical protein
MTTRSMEILGQEFLVKEFEGMSDSEIRFFVDTVTKGRVVPKKSVSIPEARRKIFDAVMAQSTWVESDSLLAQRDMRERCAEAAAKAFDEFVAELPIT